MTPEMHVARKIDALIERGKLLANFTSLKYGEVHSSRNWHFEQASFWQIHSFTVSLDPTAET